MQNAKAAGPCRPFFAFCILHFALLTTASAATFLIPSDRALVAASKAIVVVTAGEAHTQWAPNRGWIETVTVMHVDEVIKGPMHAGDTIDVTELGGIVDGIGYVVAGSPAYAHGERLLLFLETNSRGDWTSKNMVVGKFAAKEDVRGRRLLMRDAGELGGWDTDGSPHREPVRLEAAFLQFVRDAANGRAANADYIVSDPQPLAGLKPAAESSVAAEAGPAASTYLLQSNGSFGMLGIRWATFPTPVVFYSHGTQPGALNGGITSAQRALNAWTSDPGSNIVYQYGGTTTVGTGFVQADGVNSIQFNDPGNEIPGSFTGQGGDTLAVGGGWFATSGADSTHMANGERFYTIREADLVVQDGIFGPGLTGNGFDHVLTHELGHTLGLRHSDEPPAGGTSSSTAIMDSGVFFNSDPYGSTLQAWDIEAIDAVYGAASVPTCNAPTITVQPVNVDLGTTPASLSITATGDAPLHYQWYIGSRGNTAQPISGGTAGTIAVQPSVTTAYWVRITNACNVPADSNTVYVIVNGCPAVTISSESLDATIIQGKSVTLNVTASGGTVLYQWYTGTSGVTSSPIAGGTGANLTVTPAATTSYWARASNTCGGFIDSDAIVVTVQPCNAPVVVVQPVGGNVLMANGATIYAGVTGTQPMTYQWYEGAASDTSRPVSNGTSPTLITPPLFTSSSYWARMTNECGTSDSAATMVSVVATCTAPAIGSQPHDLTVAAGSSTTVSINVTGTSLTYQWYQGPVFDFTKPVGGSAPSVATGAITTPTQFWVRITSPCGTVNSTAATVSPQARRRAAKP